MQKQPKTVIRIGAIFIFAAALFRFLLRMLRARRRQKSSDRELRAIRGSMIASLARGNVDDYLGPFASDIVASTFYGRLIVGKPALREAMLHTSSISVAWNFSVADLHFVVEDASAVETGHYSMAAADGCTERAGRFVAVWKRERGQWKIVLEAVNVKGS